MQVRIGPRLGLGRSLRQREDQMLKPVLEEQPRRPTGKGLRVGRMGDEGGVVHKDCLLYTSDAADDWLVV